MSAMPSDSPSSPYTNQILSLSTRYQCAWSEHGLRISERQSVIQIYLTVCSVIFGFWFTHQGNSNDPLDAGTKARLAAFLLISVTALTLFAALLIKMHNSALAKLDTFLSDCESYCMAHIKECGDGTTKLLYFHNSATGGIDQEHIKRRGRHRIVLASILFLTNCAALALTWPVGPSTLISSICSVFLAASFAVLVSDISML